VLDIQVRGYGEISGACVIAPDGRINLGLGNRLRVEGKTLPDVAAVLAGHAGLPTGAVSVKVREYRSQPIFLIGQVVGWQRSVPYQGPETVLEVLQRVGGITPGAAVDDIYVVRAHVPDGPRPEVFHVDLKAILLHKDEKTNIRLLPYDQVYVGESARAKMLKCIPPCLRPMFFPVLGIRPIGPEGNGIRPKAERVEDRENRKKAKTGR
jgi:protein involved in polysaccharide export with SLBB domain